MDIKEAQALVLENKTVEVKPIVRNRPFFKEGHDGQFMFTGCRKTYMLPQINSTRSFKNIFKSQEEQEAFELLLNQEKGSLGVYNLKNKFWGVEYTVDITKEGKVLDLSIPSQALEYRVLKANSNRITDDWSKRGNQSFEFALIDETQLEEDGYKLSEKKEKAWDLFTKIKKSNKKMYNVLRILGKTPTPESVSNSQWLKTEVQNIMDQVEKPKGGGLNIDSFIEVAEDPRFEMKVLIFDAMDIGEIGLKNGYFRVVANDQVIGKSLQEATDWLSDIKNQEYKLLIEQRLQLNK